MCLLLFFCVVYCYLPFWWANSFLSLNLFQTFYLLFFIQIAIIFLIDFSWLQTFRILESVYSSCTKTVAYYCIHHENMETWSKEICILLMDFKICWISKFSWSATRQQWYVGFNYEIHTMSYMLIMDALI